MVTAVAMRPEVALERAPEVRNRMRRVIAFVAVADTLMVVAGVLLALQLKFGFGQWPPPQIDWFTGVAVIDFGWLVPVWLGALTVADAYSRRQFAQGTDEFKTVLRGSVAAAAVVTMVAYLVNYDMSRGFFAYAFGIGTTLLLVERYVVRRFVTHLRTQQHLLRRVLAVGDPQAIAELERALSRQPELGYQLVGACVPGDSITAAVGGVPVLGRAVDAVTLARSVAADTLIVAGGSFSSSVDLRRIGWQLEDDEIDLIVVPSLIDIAGPRIHMRPVAGLPFVHVEPPQVARAMKWGKALFDRIGSLLLLVMFAPVIVSVAVAIRCESRGPVFYRHQRIGVRGNEFGVWKFRSMVADAEQRQHELVATRDSGALLFKLPQDPRVTRVGRFLRRYSLDELPQLFNVLRGDMSLVGPRPQVADEVAEYDSSAHRRLLVRPGMTGLWQVSGRSDLSWEESVRLDLYYVDNWSMAGDIVILLKTLRAVLGHDGAY